MPRMLKIATFEDSRKTGFGFWLFGTATALLLKQRIDGQTWMICAMAAGTLFGVGTIADKYLEKMPNAAPSANAKP